MNSILFEEYSISDYVIEKSKDITNNLIKIYYETEFNKFGFKYIELHFDEPIFSIIKHIYCIIKEVDECNEGSKIINDEILIEAPMLNGELYSQHLFALVSHELEHVFQKYMTKEHGSKFRTSNIYKIAIDNLKNDNIVIRTVSNLIYKLNEKESDAFCHEYYSEFLIYKKSGMEVSKNDTYSYAKLESLKKIYDKFKSFNREEINHLLIQTFNKSYGDLDYLFRNGFRYVYKKMKNVEKKVEKYMEIDECLRKSLEIGSKHNKYLNLFNI